MAMVLAGLLVELHRQTGDLTNVEFVKTKDME